MGPGLIEVRSPEQAGRLAGSTPEERAREARRLADQINADVVVYGWLDESRTTLQPEFYVRDRVLQDAQELVGSFRLGSAIREAAAIDVEKAAGIELRETLVSRAKALSEPVFGLSYFRLGRFSDAAQHFDVALDAPGWPDSDGKEILYLFRGSSAGALGDHGGGPPMVRPRSSDQPRIRARPTGSGRGRVSRGEGSMRTRRSRFPLGAACCPWRLPGCTRSHRPTGEMPTSPPRLTWHRSRGCCASSAGRAQDSLGKRQPPRRAIVVSKFEAGDDVSLANLPRKAHGVIAISSLPVTRRPERRRLTTGDAEAEFRKAITLRLRPDRLAAFHTGLADVLGKLDRVDEARREYDVCDTARDRPGPAALSGASPPVGSDTQALGDRITRRQRANP